jgi:hypothetical protein
VFTLSNARHQHRIALRRRKLAGFVLAAVVMVGLVVYLNRPYREPQWQYAKGTVLGTRIVVNDAVENKWGSEVMYKAEYRVAYNVDGREYTTWADAGVRGESEAIVRLNLPPQRRSCRVKYNPVDPTTASAKC